MGAEREREREQEIEREGEREGDGGEPRFGDEKKAAACCYKMFPLLCLIRAGPEIRQTWAMNKIYG